ncbi:hypothetical protein PVAP13_8NG343700 [Panicum virgatum]|uniref:Uncharacterized protein n=1 Tax=Panicum virgatum TaxID=38727 RepID=A0A8T0P951_PANVG|nr:hypothetical protein PVAP13_8NG343700 [Panicum virgatum]
MEDMGTDYFNEMVSVSFFQLVSNRYYGPCYILHDLLHDLAESLSREDCFRLEDDDVTEIPCTVRQLSVRVESMEKHKQIICKLHHLRTVICTHPLMDEAHILFDQILQNCEKLRVLYLSFYNSNKLPESVGKLKHLRYLNLIKTSVSELPRSVCTLYHLQLLQLNCGVKSLPDKLCNLSKLRHLEGYYDDTTLEGPLPQITNMGKLTSLQHIIEVSVQKKGYELRQLRDLNELGGSLRIRNIENVTTRDEASESKLDQKSRLKRLQLVWSCENDMDAEDSSHLDILEGLKPPCQLNGLEINGYKSLSYPRWLQDGSYFENLESFRLADCSVLEGLPPELLWHCSELDLTGLPKLKTLSCLPACLTSLSIVRCPLLMFITKNELEQPDLRENIMTEHLSSKLAWMWELYSGPDLRSTLSEEHSSLKQLATMMDDDISNHLQIIEGPLNDISNHLQMMIYQVIEAWLCCHEQRIRLTYSRNVELPLVLPSGLCKLELSSCVVTDGALAICLGGLTSLRKLSLDNIMTLTALPSEEVFQHLTKLDSLSIIDCWCLRSLGGLRVATSLSDLRLSCCPSLELARGAEFLPSTLGRIYIYKCMLAADTFINGLPHLKDLFIHKCRSSASLSIGHLTSLESLSLQEVPDLCFLKDGQG